MPNDTLRLGNVEILALPDAHVDPSPWPLSMRFPHTPLESFEPYRSRYPDAFSAHGGPDDTPGTFTCYVVRSQGQLVLVDTGIGPAGTPMSGATGATGDLPQKLRARGVQPEEVNFVFLTHIHPDHIGWNISNGQPTFPKARYLVHQADWDAWQSAEVREIFGGFPELVEPLKGLGALDLLSGERELNAELKTLHTPGHTPGSQSLLVTSAGERALIVGDAISSPVHVVHPEWPYLFDMHAEVAADTRRDLLERLEAERMPFASSHFPVPGFGKVIRLEGRRYWQAL
ncbi:MAG: MBL fold metallo-hydrolase [Chloroflexi bacterium]|nr:MBL fold metallo-hydrolase [Chloroflexota bacterium]